MSLTQALSTALSGLQANQASLALVASNVANADTPGYTRKTINQVATSGSGISIGVRASDVQRELDLYVQRQLRTENSGASYADVRANFLSRLQDVYGQPGADNALETVYNNFTNALQALTTSPDDSAARTSVISQAQVLAQQLNQMTSSIQGLRSDAEQSISDAVAQANNAMAQIASINQKLTGMTSNDSATATLLDQRDAYIDQLSQLMDVNVIQGDNNQVAIHTTSGVQLVGYQAAQLSFNAQGSVSAYSQWSSNPTQSTLGSITLTVGANSVDITHAIRSGTIAGLVQLRDQDLVQAQNQLDSFASAMASALSDKTTDGTAVTAGAQSGFDVDLSGLSAGNKVTINYTDVGSNTAHTVTLVRVDDSSALPLSNSATTDPNDTVYGIDFSGGIGSVITQINAAIAATGMTASNPSGTTLEILDDGAANPVTVDAVSTTATVTALAGGSAELPFFTDGAASFTGAINALGSQSIGFAGRITVNGALAADPSALAAYSSGIAAGDSTRPDFVYQQLTGTTLSFSPNTGIGTSTAPFSGSLSTYLRQVISVQGEAAASANNLKQGQDIVLSTLQQRFNETSGVNIDQEMGNLLALQNAYGANARVLSAVKDMLDKLLQM
jgi:flagellar hook-associated protein 1 FlgK